VALKLMEALIDDVNEVALNMVVVVVVVVDDDSYDKEVLTYLDYYQEEANVQLNKYI
jgi:hypothetical protein